MTEGSIFRRYNYKNNNSITRDSMFMALAKRQNFKCASCGLSEAEIYEKGEALEKHRIKPGVEGGPYQNWNLKLICSTCHYHVHPQGYKNGNNGGD